MRPRFLFDENMDRAIQRQLQRLNAGIDVRLVGDVEVPPRGTSDPDILMWIEHNGYILAINRTCLEKTRKKNAVNAYLSVTGNHE